jgi:hypothetical protein
MSVTSQDSRTDDSFVLNSRDSEMQFMCSKIFQKLNAPLNQPLTIVSHQRVSSIMLKVRDALLRGACLDSKCRLMIICAAIGCMRRVTIQVDDEQHIPLLKKTSTLLFSLLVMGEESDNTTKEDERVSRHTDSGYTNDIDLNKRRRTEVRKEHELISMWNNTSLSDKINFEDEQVLMNCSSWSSILKSDVAVSRAALQEAKNIGEPNVMSKMNTLAIIFLRSSSSAMSHSLIAKSQMGTYNVNRKSFLTLDTVGMLNDANEMKDERLSALVNAAESELGQSILRDTILSFNLPASVLGVRKSVCLSREINTCATKNYPDIVNNAHEAAIRGSTWSYENDTNVIHKVSALLAGLAIVLFEKGSDIRKSNAFSGMVVLPFVDCIPPPPRVPRMTVISETNEWVVYSINSRGMPSVKFKQAGFDGFCKCVLLIAKNALK